MSWGFMDEKIFVMTKCKWFSWNSDLNKYEVGIHGWKILASDRMWMTSWTHYLNVRWGSWMKKVQLQREIETESQRGLPLFSLIALPLYSRVSCKVPSWSLSLSVPIASFFLTKFLAVILVSRRLLGVAMLIGEFFQPVLRICILFVCFFFLRRIG